MKHQPGVQGNGPINRPETFRLYLPASVQQALVRQRAGMKLLMMLFVPMLMPLVLYGRLPDPKAWAFLALFTVSAFVFSATLPGSTLFAELSLNVLPHSVKGVRIHMLVSVLLIFLTGAHYLHIGYSNGTTVRHFSELLFIFFSILPALSTISSVFGLTLSLFGVLTYLSLAPVIFAVNVNGEYYPGIGFVGYFIACFYVSMLLLENDNLLRERGWSRSVKAHSPKRGEFMRPSGSSLVLALTLLFLPALVITFSSLSLIPGWMIVSFVPIIPAAAICNAYTNSTQNNQVLTLAVSELLVLATGLMLTSALLFN